MVAVVIVEAVALVILGVLVAGLLRSHAEILRALHRLGVGLEGGDAGPTLQLGATRLGTNRFGATDLQKGSATGGPAHDLTGVSPQGGALHVAVNGTGRTTLLAFLTSGCLTCADFWSTFTRPGGFELPAFVDRLVVVTKGIDRESPAEVLARAPKRSAGIPVVMSGEAWDDYEVPVSPYFVLVDGATDRVAGEGAAGSWDQLQSLLARALADAGHDVIDMTDGDMMDGDMTDGDMTDGTGGEGRRGGGGREGDDDYEHDHEHDHDLGSSRRRPRRERADSALASAGIEPGHPSLYGET